MTATYRPAPAVARIAGTLIPEHHQDLEDVRIEYVFRSEAARSGGKLVWGKARKITGLNAFLASGDGDELPVDGDDVDEFFVIEIAEDVWRELDEKARRALIDHELSHCGTKVDSDGDLRLTVIAHDLEEFSAVVERHGLWRPDVEDLVKAAWSAEQLPFDGKASA